jgi:hypothetical protein
MAFRRVLETIAGAVLISVLMISPVIGMSQKPPEPSYIQGQVVLKFRGDVSQERIMEIVAAEGGTVIKVLKRSGLHLVSLPVDRKVLPAVDSFSRYPEVLSAEPNYQNIQPLSDQ